MSDKMESLKLAVKVCNDALQEAQREYIKHAGMAGWSVEYVAMLVGKDANLHLRVTDNWQQAVEAYPFIVRVGTWKVTPVFTPEHGYYAERAFESHETEYYNYGAFGLSEEQAVFKAARVYLRTWL